jgi:hypothetical protein
LPAIAPGQGAETSHAAAACAPAPSAKTVTSAVTNTRALLFMIR